MIKYNYQYTYCWVILGAQRMDKYLPEHNIHEQVYRHLVIHQKPVILEEHSIKWCTFVYNLFHMDENY